MKWTMADAKLLKKDLFGEVRFATGADGGTIVRDTASARPWLAWLARRLLLREASILAALGPLGEHDQVPELLHSDARTLTRRYIDGLPMQEAQPRDPTFFHAAACLLRSLHRCNVVHNDLAKEPNILVRADGAPAFIDFQLALLSPRRGRLFRMLAYEDIRHLLKHKRTYCPDKLTARERQILANPSAPSRLFRGTVKPAYLFVTRRLLGWADREGAADRGRLS
jgi:RIO-like serine/threonine protein kinase